MVSSAVIYFIVASLGENFEGRHEATAVVAAEEVEAATGSENMVGAPQHEAAENSHNVNSGRTEGQNNGSASSNGENITEILQHKEEGAAATERSNTQLETNRTHIAQESNNESAKRSIESPFFLTAGIAYVLVGLWMVLDKKNSRVPYVIAMVGSILLIGLYITSHTVGLPSIGLEQIGPLDLFVTSFQGGIVVACGYILLSSSKTITRIHPT